ncbi:MAG: hypothetical protein ACTHN0_00650 [Aquihabitans sp.]
MRILPEGDGALSRPAWVLIGGLIAVLGFLFWAITSVTARLG